MGVDDTILFETKGKIATITLNNPEKLNTFTVERLIRLRDIIEEIRQNKKIRCVLIRAAGDRVFSAGLDTKMLTGGDPTIKERIVEHGTVLSESLFYLPVPVISVITGHAVGWGCIISMLSDFRFAIDTMHFRLPELGIGIYPATGALTLCMMHLGPSLGNEVLFLDKKLTAREAKDCGFVNGIGSTREEVEKMAMDAAKFLSRINQQVAMFSKMNVRLLQNIEYSQALELEKRCFEDLLKLGSEEDWHQKYLEHFEKLKNEFK
ncbi:MAG: enoyl-CoA hydratase/isomerase family protein [Promethearchaeota archaeon]